LGVFTGNSDAHPYSDIGFCYISPKLLVRQCTRVLLVQNFELLAEGKH